MSEGSTFNVSEYYASLDTSAIIKNLCGLQVLAAIVFFASSISVADTANSGFNIVVTACLLLLYPLISYYIIGNYRRPLYIGGIIGAGIVLSFMILETAIYWGQLSLCEPIDVEISHYSCDNRIGYRFVSLFGIIVFVLQFCFTGYMLYKQEDLLKDFAEYEELSTSQDVDKPAPSADL